MNEVQKKLLVHGEVIIVGIDVAKHNHWARIYNQIELDVVKPFKFHNSKEGYYRLVAKMEGTCQDVVGKKRPHIKIPYISNTFSGSGVLCSNSLRLSRLKPAAAYGDLDRLRELLPALIKPEKGLEYSSTNSC
ncbi:hypothetical protein MGLY_08570 [Neomoorella glycerini]|uniref:Transposase, IS111A/IS1328/IS1533, N-terminal n=1 Tax=Neomoorella glycerini TaxID=55779 RepID=A0A6I5ZNN5_9FIRM|nr:hypothetical protein MGLY_08570 [Moorella glycerini]